MNNSHRFFDSLRQARILKPPKHALATFGTTTLSYVLLSPIPNEPNVCRLREGSVVAQRPQIITPDVFRQRFEGFGEDMDAYRELMERAYGEGLRSLEYTFRNDLSNTSLEHTTPAEMIERTRNQMEKENAPRKALLEGPDQAWGLAVMKFIVETSMRSFQGNVRELEERGLFDPEGRAQAATKREIEKRFAQAQSDPSAVSRLGEYLHQSGYFKEYEDRFFALVQR